MSQFHEGPQAHRASGAVTPSPALRLGIRLLSWAPALIIATIVLVIPSDLYIKTLATDDALYYPIIARNIARGLGSTYDNGLTLTNGYHPLLAWLQVPIAFSFGGGSRFTYLWWIKALIVAMAVLSIYVWGRVTSKLFDDDVPVMTYRLLLGAYPWSICNLYGGMETPLVVLMMGLVVLYSLRTVRYPTMSLWDSTLLGILVAGTFLSRLDSIFFLSTLSVLVAFIVAKRRQFKRLLVTFGTATIAIAPYLLWNLAHFGHIIPVSGLKKTPGLEFAARWAQLDRWWVGKFERLLSVFGPVGLGLLALAVVVAMVVARREVITAAKKWNLIWSLPVGAALHYVYVSLFMNEGDVGWYHYSEYLTGYLMVSTLVYAVALRCRKSGAPKLAYVPASCIAVLAVAMVAMHPVGIFPNPVNATVFEAAIWANEQTSAVSRFGMYDSGVFSFVSDRATMSLNGLAGDRELLDLTLARDMRSIISRYNLDYLVTGIPERELNTLDSGDIAYLSTKFSLPGYQHLGILRYAVITPGVYRKERPWQLIDSSLCRNHSILQEGCPKQR